MVKSNFPSQAPPHITPHVICHRIGSPLLSKLHMPQINFMMRFVTLIRADSVMHQIRLKIVKRQSAVEVRFPREHVIFGDIPEPLGDDGFYKP